MQQSLARRQPSARFRPSLREIPLQRMHGYGESEGQRTSPDDRSVPVTSGVTAAPDLPPGTGDERRPDVPLGGGGVLGDVENAPDAAAEQDVQAETAGTTGPAERDEQGPDLVGDGIAGGDVPEDVEVPAAPAVEAPAEVGEPEEAPDLRQEDEDGRPGPQVLDERGPDQGPGGEVAEDVEVPAAPAAEPVELEEPGGDVRQEADPGVDQVASPMAPTALSAGTEDEGAERVDPPTLDEAGDQPHETQPADGQAAEEGRPAPDVFAA